MIWSSVILPGASLGVVGNGQLAKMFAMQAQQMGYKVVIFAPDDRGPANQVSGQTICASYDNVEALKDFASKVAVVTLEFENIPVRSLEVIEAITPVRPRSKVLAITQHRLHEKTFLVSEGLPVVKHVFVASLEDLISGLEYVGLPAVLKTTTLGYDGKGQILLREGVLPENLLLSFSDSDFLLEQFVEIDKELSVIGARGSDGQFAALGVIENYHRQHILDLSIAPATITDDLAQDAVSMTESIMKKLDVVGLLSVEFFLTRQGQLLVNELAPRPHNSGHLTIEACVSSQFEQQVRAVTGLPLGTTTFISPAAMANLLGDLWVQGEPNWFSALSTPGLHLHLYGKADARPGRKMGHLTALANSANEAVRLVTMARQQL